MAEVLGLVVFSLIVYFFLIVVPTVMEKISSPEFRKSYFSHLASTHIHSYGK